MRKLLAAALIATLWAKPAMAVIAYTGLSLFDSYQQTASGLSPLGSSISFGLNTQGPSDFTSAVVVRPGNPVPLNLTYSPFLVADGSYRAAFASEFYPNIAQLNANNPFGVYTYTATNASGASESSSLLYDSNHWPSNLPLLNDATFSSLNGLDVSRPFTFEFNNFTGDGFNPFPNGPVNPSTLLLVANSAGTLVYNSGALDPSTTSFTLPGGILDPGADYFVGVAFNNTVHAPLGSPDGYFLNFQQRTFAAFTTAEGPALPVTLANIQGGTPDDPLPLPVVGRIGQLTGSIGDAGSTDFFKFFWSGGLFEASAFLTGADPSASFQFRLYDNLSTLLEDIRLDASNGYSATMSQTLSPGLFTVGLLANEHIDPAFTITFLTPVEGAGAVPEPSTWTLMLVAVGAVGLMLRRSRRCSLSPKLGHDRGSGRPLYA